VYLAFDNVFNKRMPLLLLLVLLLLLLLLLPKTRSLHTEHFTDVYRGSPYLGNFFCTYLPALCQTSNCSLPPI